MNRKEKLKKSWKLRKNCCLAVTAVLFIINTVIVSIETTTGLFIFSILAVTQAFLIMVAGYCFNKGRDLAILS